jgi:hypothetical protein
MPCDNGPAVRRFDDPRNNRGLAGADNQGKVNGKGMSFGRAMGMQDCCCLPLQPGTPGEIQFDPRLAGDGMADNQPVPFPLSPFPQDKSLLFLRQGMACYQAITGTGNDLHSWDHIHFT